MALISFFLKKFTETQHWLLCGVAIMSGDRSSGSTVFALLEDIYRLKFAPMANSVYYA